MEKIERCKRDGELDGQNEKKEDGQEVRGQKELVPDPI